MEQAPVELQAKLSPRHKPDLTDKVRAGLIGHAPTLLQRCAAKGKVKVLPTYTWTLLFPGDPHFRNLRDLGLSLRALGFERSAISGATCYVMSETDFRSLFLRTENPI
jgi:hypothetical protein